MEYLHTFSLQWFFSQLVSGQNSAGVLFELRCSVKKFGRVYEIRKFEVNATNSKVMVLRGRKHQIPG